MATNLLINGLLTLPTNYDISTLKEGQDISIEKEGNRFMPFYHPMEFATHDHKYLGKALVTELRLVKDKTYLTFKVLKLFSPEEQKVYNDNFIKHE